MDFAAELDSNMIIVVNDNDMSIAENHGGLYSNLKLLRETNGQAECNLFKAMGLDYVYVDHGNDLREQENKDTLVEFQENYPGVLNGDNLADVLKAARAKKQEKKEK